MENENTDSGGQDGASDNNADAGGDFNFRDHVTGDLKEKYTDIKDIDSLMKGYDGMVSKMGENPITRLKEGATPEETAAYHSSIGRPDSADKYEFNVPEYPEGYKPDDARLGDVKKMFFDAGVPKDMAEKIISGYMANESELIKGQIDAAAAEMKEAEDSLKTEWGAEYQSKVDATNAFANKYATSDDDKAVIKEFGNNPSFIRMMNNLAKQTGEDTSSRDGGSTNASDSVTLSNRKSHLMKTESAYWNALDVGHEAAVREVRDINTKLVAMQSAKQG